MSFGGYGSTYIFLMEEMILYKIYYSQKNLVKCKHFTKNLVKFCKCYHVLILNLVYRF